MNLVERIEVLKGSASTLYGSDAQGGVINIVTRKQIGNGYGKLHTDYGSFKTSHVGLSAGGTEKGLNWYIAAQNKNLVASKMVKEEGYRKLLMPKLLMLSWAKLLMKKMT